MHNCSPAMDGCRLFRKDRLGKQGGGFVLYLKEQKGYMELCLVIGEEPDKSLWVRITTLINKRTIVVGVCFRSPDQVEVDEAFFR